MIYEIEQHFKEQYPREGCGVIAIVKGKKKWFPCTNIAKDDEDFIIDSQEYLKLKRTTDVIAIVHSHPDASSEASATDVKYCNAIGIPYHIYSYPEMDLNILDPVKSTIELYGREYEFGVRDCFEATRDYLASKNINIPTRDPFEDDWWERGIEYFTPEIIAEWHHVPVPMDTPQENDVLVFNVKAAVGNHCGVYVGNDCFYHHAITRLSCRESLYPLWYKYLTGVYRYDA
jgi:proteasome lid subunit RPN8/RPN11|tara:strand:+ start:2077 stop:2769 length:693 start_codon:yes stop_codon:yes gene_type:complete